jgi:tRNA (uracil-5-)-methyltransferase
MFQDMAYEEQLLLKKEMVNDTLQGIAAVEGVQPSGPYRYRNRMDFVAAFGKVGLRRAGSFRSVVDITGCRIMQEKSEALFRNIRPLVLETEGYDYIRHDGYLRYVVLREARYTGQVMMNFVTAVRENRLRPVIETIVDAAHSISIVYNSGLADVSYGEAYETVKGGFIEESFDGILYRITPNSFFQSNSEVALMMYRRIREEAEGRVLDLCAGVGSISLFIAEKAAQVTGVEMNGEAVEAANINAQTNLIENAEFICADVKDFLKNSGAGYDTIVMDPPRTGMQPAIMKNIDRLMARKIVYMSCSPASFRDDVSALGNYAIESVEAYDMFPQTPHVELLGVLKRIK